MKVLGSYKNGTVLTTIFTNGTKMRLSFNDEFRSDFAENIDIKITNRCTGSNCEFCHEGSGPNGEHGDIMNLKFIDTLHPFQEVAIGGGNVLEHPDFISFLQKLKSKKVIANITLHQIHFMQNISLIHKLINEKLIYGIGVSLVYPTEKLIEEVQKIPSCIIHVINGIVSPEVIQKLVNKNLKILVLGYKQLRRGKSFYNKEEDLIKINQNHLKNIMPELLRNKAFKLISFDNLAIDQLNIKSLLSQSQLNKLYMGDEGTNTFYIDCVNKKFARSSTEKLEDRFDLLDSVDEMFHFINKKIKTE